MIDRIRRFTQGVAVLLTTTSAAMAADRGTVHVVEGTGCECCSQWTEYLRQNGFEVTSEERYGALLIRHKMDLGVPTSQLSCHTGDFFSYLRPPSSPPAPIAPLFRAWPHHAGLAVPGMPYGSPGMGPENKRKAYDVNLVKRDGSVEVFSHYPAAQ